MVYAFASKNIIIFMVDRLFVFFRQHPYWEILTTPKSFVSNTGILLVLYKTAQNYFVLVKTRVTGNLMYQRKKVSLPTMEAPDPNNAASPPVEPPGILFTS